MGRPNPAITQAWADHLGVPADTLDIEALRARLTAGTVPDALARAADEHPTSTLSVDSDRVTLSELRELVRRRATALSRLGVAATDRVVISAASSLELVVTYLAVLQTGATAILVNPAYTPAEVGSTMRRAGAALLLTEDVRLLNAIDADVVTLTDVTRAAADSDPLDESPATSESVALLAFTSGTTGVPKGVPLTHAHLLSSIRAAMWSWRWTDSDVLVHALPLFHQHGLSGVHATLLAGSSAALLSRFTPEALADAIDRQNGTVLFGVPSIHRRLLELPAGQLSALGNLRLITSGSAPLPVPLAEKFHAATGVHLLERYGLTESGLDLSNPYSGTRVPGSVGTPLPGVEVGLADERGDTVPDGEDGEIVLRGPQVFDGYLDDAAATRAAFWPGGWFRTGDLGRWDGDRLLITGRLKDLVITGGMNVSPAEVEAVVEQLDEVHEAAVAGLPSERWGEEVTVWVVPVNGRHVDADRVMRHCRDHLAAYKCPKRVIEVPELPRNPMGKIVRSKLTESAP